MTENCEIKIENLKIDSNTFKKYRKVVEDHYQKRTKDAVAKNQELESKFWEFHHSFAVKNVFFNYSELKSIDNDEDNEEYTAYGLVQKQYRMLIFEDDKMKDFFIADYIIKCIKSLNVSQELVEVFVDILTDRRYVTILQFINDGIENESALNNVEDKMQNFSEKFYKMNNFYEYFRKNLENLFDFITKIIFNLDREKMKKIVDKNAIYSACDTKNPNLINKFQKFLSEFYSNDEFKKILLSEHHSNKTMLHNKVYSLNNIQTFYNLWAIYRTSFNDHEFLKVLAMKDNCNGDILHIAGRCSADKVFVTVLEELEKIPLKDEIRNILRNLGDVKQNLLQSASYSLQNLETHKLIWKIYPKYFDKAEMVELINYINDHDNNLLFDLINTTSENADFIWNQMKLYLSHEEQVKCLTTERCHGQNIVERCAHNWTEAGKVEAWIKGILQDYGLPIPRNSYDDSFPIDGNYDNDAENLENDSKDFKYYKNLLEDHCKKLELHDEFAVTQNKELEEKFFNFHHLLATKTFFPDDSIQNDAELSEEEVLNFGIVGKKDESFKFLDANMQNYLIADYILKALKNSNQSQEVLTIFVKILTGKKHGIIRKFINEALEDSSVLNNYGDKMKEFSEYFLKMNTFAEYFTKNLENLVDFIIKIIFNLDREKMKTVIDKDAIFNACDTNMINKLQKFLFEFYSLDEMKEFSKSYRYHSIHDSYYNSFKNVWTIYRKSLNDHEFLELLIRRDYDDEDILHTAGRYSDKIFVFLFEEIDKIPLKDEVRTTLKTLGRFQQNLLQTVSYDLQDLESHKFLWKIYSKYFDQKEMLEFITYINGVDNNLLYDIVHNKSENADFIWNQMKTYLTHEEQVEILKTERGGMNIIQRCNNNWMMTEEIKEWIRDVLQEYEIPIPSDTPPVCPNFYHDSYEVHENHEYIEINSNDFSYYKEIAEDHYRKLELASEISDTKSQELKLKFWKFQQFSSLKSLFPDYSDEIEREMSNEEFDGFVVKKDDDLEFCDKNMQKYFVADYIVKSLKNSTESHVLLKIFVEILTKKKHGIIKKFINEAIEDNSVLKNYEDRMQEFKESFHKMDTFAEYFRQNLENLVDFVIKIIFNLDSKKMKAVIDKNAIYSAFDTKLINKLQEFLSEFYTNDEFKEILKSSYNYSKTMLHSSFSNSFKNVFMIYRKTLNDHELLEILMENECGEDILHTAARYSDENFIFLLEEIDKIPLRDEVKKALKTYGNCKQNLLQTASYDLQSLESHKVLWKIYPKYFNQTEMLELITYINSHDNNLLYDLLHNKSENAEFIWNQMKMYMTHEEQVKCLTTKRCGGQNIMERCDHNSNPSEIRRWVEKVLQEYGLEVPKYKINYW